MDAPGIFYFCKSRKLVLRDMTVHYLTEEAAIAYAMMVRDAVARRQLDVLVFDDGWTIILPMAR